MTRPSKLGLLLLLGAAFCLTTPAFAAPSTDSAEATAVRKKKKKKKTVRRKTTKRRRTPKKRRRAPRAERTPVVSNLLAKGSIGLKLGFNLSWLTLDHSGNPLEYDSSGGFQGGVQYAKSINNNIGYAAELLFAQKGGQLSTEGNTGSTGPSQELTLNYVEVPLMLTFRGDVTPSVTPFLNAGVYGGFLLGTDLLVDGVRQTELNGTRVDEFYSSIDYGMVVGLGAYFVMSKTIMGSAEMRYSHGFADIDNHEVSGTREADRTHNRSFSIMGGIHF